MKFAQFPSFDTSSLEIFTVENIPNIKEKGGKNVQEETHSFASLDSFYQQIT